MRVLWVDADENPWTDPNGWRVLEDFGVETHRVSTESEAERELGAGKKFAMVLIRAELPGSASLLEHCRGLFAGDERKVVLTSSKWSKEQFRAHSRTGAAAHRYARVPMPPEGFLSLVSDLFGCTVDELAGLELPDPEPGLSEGDPPSLPSPAPRKGRKAKAPAAGGADLDDMNVLRKYLTMREEQLEIAEGERDELSAENERLRKEAQRLQARLREFDRQQDELGRKLGQLEESRAEAERDRLGARDESERAARIAQERAKSLESQIAEATEKYESLRVRVRKDIRKIRENERSLEARLELVRKDSETLLQARDAKVLELQRKLDALEFDLDQVQDGRVQAQMEAERYLAKLSRVSRALQVATSLIEDEPSGEAELEELEPLVGGAANAEEPAAAAADAMPAAAEAPAEPVPEEAGAPEEPLSPELAALAAEGEPTQMISAESLQKMGGEHGSSG